MRRDRRQLEPAAHGPDDDALGDNSPCRWLCRQIGRIALSTLAVLVVLSWLLVGRLLSLQTLASPAVLSVLTWAVVVALFVQLLSSTVCGLSRTLQDELHHGYAGFGQSLLDVVAVFTVTMLAAAICGGWAASSTVLRPRRCALLPVIAVVLLHTVFVATKVVAMTWAVTIDESGSKAGSSSSDSPESCAVSILASKWLLSAAQMSVVLTAAWSSRIWAQATPERLKAAERNLVEARVNGRLFRQRVVAGIGTLEAGPGSSAAVDRSLPCGESQSENTQTIVLIHGLGAGNGLWCENIEALSARHRLLCVEWRGCGRSDRPKFTARTYGET